MKKSLRTLEQAAQIAYLCLISATLFAQETPSFNYSEYPVEAPSIQQEPVIQIYVTLADKVTVGTTGLGERHIVPITGGEFIGVGMQGRVVPGGADWQLTGSDEVKQIHALYYLEAEDGTNIIVDNRGIVAGAGETRYARTRPVLHAPEGPHAWLNEKLFVGTITSFQQPRAVLIRIYQVD